MIAAAQTNLQLYEQLRAQERPIEDLLLVRRVYDYCTTLYSGLYQSDGRPFINHCVGVASVLAGLSQPIEVVAAGLLHNVYSLGDFGDGAENRASEQRRRRIREAVGPQIEEVVARFQDFRLNSETIVTLRENAATLGELEKTTVVMDLADAVDKHANLAMQYASEPLWGNATDARVAHESIELAELIGQPELADMLREVFKDETWSDIPARLRFSGGNAHTVQYVPPSCLLRPDVAARRGLRQLWWSSCRVFQLRRVYNLTLARVHR